MEIAETKVVLDTNVVVSAAVSSDGNPAKIFEMIINSEIKNYTSSQIIEEIKEVMGRERIKEALGDKDARFFIDTFEKLSEKIIPIAAYDEIKEDSDDNKFLDCAMAAGAEYIISGDGHLLKLKEFGGIKIVSPADFIGLIK